jgi:bifunctional non-homologous end joining protein LigD
MLPLVRGRPVTMQQCPNGIGRGGFLQKQTGGLAAAALHRLLDDLTTEGRIADRGGRLYLDIGRNGYAQTMAAPYAVRALPGAPVSVPLHWSELDELDPGRHTLRTITERLDLPDPWAGIDQAASTLDQAGGRLAELGGFTPR